SVGHKRHSGRSMRQPLRVVFDRRARLPLDSQLLRTLDVSPVLVVVSQGADPSRLAALREAGAEILVADGIEAALAELGRRGIASLFLEGGSTLAAAFIVAGAIDEARTFVAPLLLGGSDPCEPGAEREGGGARAGAGLFAGRVAPLAEPELRKAGRRAPPDTPTLPPDVAVEQVGDDVLIKARFKEW
ncbi:MAG: RibD family protein, partial [Solirubrobacterales bacterium]